MDTGYETWHDSYDKEYYELVPRKRPDYNEFLKINGKLITRSSIFLKKIEKIKQEIDSFDIDDLCLDEISSLKENINTIIEKLKIN